MAARVKITKTMPVQDTSAKSYQEHQSQLNVLKWKVYNLICEADEKGISNHEIAARLILPTATVSGLTRPLVKDNFVKRLAKRRCKITGNMVIAWAKKVSDIVQQEETSKSEKEKMCDCGLYMQPTISPNFYQCPNGHIKRL